MVSLRRACLLLLTAFWLPVQTMTAFIMPLGLLSLPASAQAATPVGESVAPVSCHGHDMTEPVVQDPAAHGPGDNTEACQQCGVCHLACAGYVPTHQMSGWTSPAVAVQVPAAVRYLPNRATPPPHHPPRA